MVEWRGFHSVGNRLVGCLPPSMVVGRRTWEDVVVVFDSVVNYVVV